MIDKASPAGWVVQVAIRATPAPTVEGSRRSGPVGLAAPSFHYFNVAIADPSEAAEATKKHLAKAKSMAGEMSTVRQLSSGEIAALSLKAGEVKPA